MPPIELIIIDHEQRRQQLTGYINALVGRKKGTPHNAYISALTLYDQLAYHEGRLIKLRHEMLRGGDEDVRRAFDAALAAIGREMQRKL
jgi:hypothetical protein